MNDPKNGPVEDRVGITTVEDDGLTWPLPKSASENKATELSRARTASCRFSNSDVARARDKAARLSAMLKR